MKWRKKESRRATQLIRKHSCFSALSTVCRMNHSNAKVWIEEEDNNNLQNLQQKKNNNNNNNNRHPSKLHRVKHEEHVCVEREDDERDDEAGHQTSEMSAQ